MDQEAKILIGFPTSHFPKESFINTLLYGHSDVNFTYQDFMNSYGIKVDKPDEGYLVIGNDLKLGGMVLDTIETVALPIPWGTITEVPFTLLSKYFPNGYSILASKDSEYIYGLGYEVSFYNNMKICDKCYSGFGFADDQSTTPLKINSFWEKWAMADIIRYDFHIFGYLKDFDYKNYSGNIKMAFYQVYGQGLYAYHLVDENYSNLIKISSSDKNNFTYEGSLFTHNSKNTSFYNFSGWWRI